MDIKPNVILQMHKYLYKYSSKSKERTETIIRNHLGKISKKEIINMCPDVSIGSIERVLNEILKEDKILKITGGRYTKYLYAIALKKVLFIFTSASISIPKLLKPSKLCSLYLSKPTSFTLLVVYIVSKLSL